ncbi:MAG: hypothetical protein QOD69_2515 [Solirubrobacteraceae bacterium]|nr:hypothetical protein [Solirubrobacteraceae bacterium]
MQELHGCPICGTSERTLVSEYGGAILDDEALDEGVPRSDFMLCHGCGVLYAARRPDLSADGSPTLPYSRHRGETGVLDHVGALSDAQLKEARKRASHGAFVSSHARISRRKYFPALREDRMKAAVHLDLLASLLELGDRQVLEVGSRSAALGDQLRRCCGAVPHALVLTDAHREVTAAAYGTPAATLDLARFRVPFDGPFDLIAAQGMLTRTIDPARFLSVVRSKLAPGGVLYLYGEPDQEYALRRGKSVFTMLAPGRYQTFDGPALLRALAAQGFAPEFVADDGTELACLVRATDEGFTPMSEPVLLKRVEEHARWRQSSVLRLTGPAAALYADSRPGLLSDALASGIAERGVRWGARVLVRSVREVPRRTPGLRRPESERSPQRGLFGRALRRAGLGGEPRSGVLTELGVRHGTNKAMAIASRQPLTDIYDTYLRDRRREVRRVLEFGIEEGGSLRMWRDFFPSAEIVGVDIVADRTRHAGDRITVLIGDQTDPDVIAQAVAPGPLDLVVDDGSHQGDDQVRSLLAVWPHVAPGGLYVIEDIHTSYLEKYAMGWRRPGSMVERLKDLLDDVHGPLHEQPVELEDLESVHLHFMTCVLRRRAAV